MSLSIMTLRMKHSIMTLGIITFSIMTLIKITLSFNDTQRNDTQHTDILYNVTQHTCHSANTSGIMLSLALSLLIR
jgi:hypothetical protein